MATKVKCQCGLELNEDNMNKHLTTKTHGELIERKYRKLNKFTVTDISKEYHLRKYKVLYTSHCNTLVNH